jgi:hypothetical protein
VSRAAAWLYPEVPLARLALLRVAVYAFVVCDMFWVVDDVVPHARGVASLYRPLVLREWLHLPVPNPGYVLTVRAVVIVACVLAASGRAGRGPGRLAGFLVAAGFTDWVSIGMSYGKIDHDHFALIVAVWVLPTAGAARWWGPRVLSPAAGWALVCVQCGCVAIYFLSAVAKVRYGGWDWVTGSTFAWAMTRRGTGLGRALLEPPWVLVAAQIGLFSMELLTPAILFLRARWRYLAIAGLGAFHLITYLTLGIHFLPLVVCLLAFLPLERVLERPRFGRFGRSTGTGLTGQPPPGAGAAPSSASPASGAG